MHTEVFLRGNIFATNFLGRLLEVHLSSDSIGMNVSLGLWTDINQLDSYWDIKRTKCVW